MPYRAFDAADEQEVRCVAEDGQFQIHYHDEHGKPRMVSTSIEAAREAVQRITILLDNYEQETGDLISKQDNAAQQFCLVSGLSGMSVYTARLGKQAHGRLLMECGVFSSRLNAEIALRHALTIARTMYPERDYTERDFEIEVDDVDPLAKEFW